MGHLALQFLNKWGCEVTAFSSNPDKTEQLKALGAHKVVNSRDPEQLAALAGTFDFVMNTTNVNLEWGAYIEALAPKGRLHTVGAVPDPIEVPAFSLIGKQRSVSGSPLGSPATLAKMLDFCARHDIKAMVEHFPMSQANEAMDHLKAGKARYRIVLNNEA
nr:zinc-binding dehydrogenase [Acanthopleuribacter pedis]